MLFVWSYLAWYMQAGFATKSEQSGVGSHTFPEPVDIANRNSTYGRHGYSGMERRRLLDLLAVISEDGGYVCRTGGVPTVKFVTYSELKKSLRAILYSEI